MKVEDIKKLPKKFNFKSKINPFDIVYHAKEIEHGYIVTCDSVDCNWYFTKADIRRKLLKNEYVIVNGVD